MQSQGVKRRLALVQGKAENDGGCGAVRERTLGPSREAREARRSGGQAAPTCTLSYCPCNDCMASVSYQSCRKDARVSCPAASKQCTTSALCCHMLSIWRIRNIRHRMQLQVFREQEGGAPCAWRWG